MTRNCHVPFWRAVEEVTSSLTLIILNIAKQTTVGQTGSNATGLATSTLLGGTLAKQVTRMNVESPPSRYS
jgi:hypothetical protein